MWQLILISLISLISHAFLQTEDPHMCIENVIVSYIVNEPTPVEEYGMFAHNFTILGIKGTLRNITKTKLEPQRICCPGYEKADLTSENCQLSSTTAIPDESTTEQLASTIPDFNINENLRSSSDNTPFNYTLILFGSVALLLIIILIAFVFLRFKRNSNRIQESGHELDEPTELFIKMQN